MSLMSPADRLARLRELQAKAALVIEGDAEEVVSDRTSSDHGIS
jgi:hypothetical protein